MRGRIATALAVAALSGVAPHDPLYAIALASIALVMVVAETSAHSHAREMAVAPVARHIGDASPIGHRSSRRLQLVILLERPRR